MIGTIIACSGLFVIALYLVIEKIIRDKKDEQDDE
jgi:hypothetical protein